MCCGKTLPEGNQNGWHTKCIRSFFHTDVLPEVEMNNELLQELVAATVNQGTVVTGVQKKLSMHLHSETEHTRLTLSEVPAGYILKPHTEQYPYICEAEHLVMSMAEKAGISTVPHALMKLDDGMAYITKRIDRSGTEKTAMEDFCQLDQRLTEDKYNSSYERCSKVISRYSSSEKMDQSELFMRLVFCFITGNSDMHLKNFSLIETECGSREYRLSPAYDLVPVNLILPEDSEQTALTLNGKKRNLRKKDFMVFADHCGISKKAAEKMIAGVVKCLPSFRTLCEESFLPDEMKKRMNAMMEERCSILLNQSERFEDPVI
ncbi:MAG: HipA domain-containing protein [Bulleidia sp.]